MKEAVRTAAREARDAAAAGPDGQLALLPELVPPRPAPSAGPGRPKGASNLASRAFRAHFLSRFPSPVEAAAAVYVKSAAELAKELGCPAIEAEKLRLRAMEIAAPYVERKQPMAVEVEGTVRPVMAIIDPRLPMAEELAALAEATGDGGILDLIPEPLPFQDDCEAETVVSNDHASNGDAK